VIPAPREVRKEDIHSYVGEKREMTLLNVPAAMMPCSVVEIAETIPVIGVSGIPLVEIEVWGGPGIAREKNEMSEFVPHIKLKIVEYAQ
jgi:hypothetical protein